MIITNTASCNALCICAL